MPELGTSYLENKLARMFSVILQDTTYSVEKNTDETLVNQKALTWDLKWMGDRKIHLI